MQWRSSDISGPTRAGCVSFSPASAELTAFACYGEQRIPLFREASLLQINREDTVWATTNRFLETR